MQFSYNESHFRTKEGRLRFFYVRLFIFLFWIAVHITSCNKLVGISEPINTITGGEAFSTDALATSALNAIYSDMSYFGGNGLGYSNGATAVYAGLASDELNYFGGVPVYQNGTILATDGTIYGAFWRAAYSHIYMANAAIENLNASKTLSEKIKSQLTGEALFIRALCYFYIINLFGDAPLVTSSDWSQNSLSKRTPTDQVYQQIIADLKQAQGLLIDDYSLFSQEHIRANKWAATALLARVYLYTSDFASADAQASSVINSGYYSLLTNLDSVFLKNSNEAILQLQTVDHLPYATWEGYNLVPPDAFSNPNYYLTDQLIGAFEPLDKRWTAWVDSTNYAGTEYFYPYKYKKRQGSSNSDVTEYFTLLRFAEQYLIRAEAKARLNTDLQGAINDLNSIRKRAGLTELSLSLNQTNVLAAINQERRIELFAEEGHRWFDLKRAGQAIEVLSPLKPGWDSHALLWPIPTSELRRDPNLTQNEGYQ